VLKASGVPNDNGQPRWPLGLCILAAPGADELREQLDALFQVAAIQTLGGPVNPQLAQEMDRAVKKFRRMLLKDKVERFGMTRAVYEESERFLDKLERAEQILTGGLATPAGGTQLTTGTPSSPRSSGQAAPEQGQEQEGTTEVTLQDNSFQPGTLTVPAGTTVRWTNRGQHRHTVTSDDGQWGSRELNPQGVYSQTFAKPGTYPYHCGVHPQEMRGTVIVK
jgi:plastocyanin